MWGLIPAAGLGSRIQPLAFSKELLPLGARQENGREGLRTVSEHLVERMLLGGVTKLCFIISPEKTDIVRYYGNRVDGIDISYVVQPAPGGLCDAVFRAHFLVDPSEPWIIGLPDTVWFPQNALTKLPDAPISFLLFPVEKPQFFDAVVTDASGRVERVEVKSAEPSTHWVWGAIRMQGSAFLRLRELWCQRNPRDEYLGTLVNEFLNQGGWAIGAKAGETYVDVGTPSGYREAIHAIASHSSDHAPTVPPPESLHELSIIDPGRV